MQSDNAKDRTSIRHRSQPTIRKFQSRVKMEARVVSLFCNCACKRESPGKFVKLEVRFR